MRATPVAIATCVGLAVFGFAGPKISPSLAQETAARQTVAQQTAQVMGVTLGGPFSAPFKSPDGAQGSSPQGSSIQGSGNQTAPYSPYVSRGDERTLTSETIERYLLDRGFSDITGLRRRGGSYTCEATGPRRERVRLVLDAASGEISGVQVIGFEDKRY